MNAVSIIGLCISGVVLLLTIVRDIIARLRETKKDTAEDVNETYSLREGILKANIKLDTVCSTTQETRTDIKAMNKQLTDIDKRLTIAETNIKDAFDEIKELRITKADKEA